MASAGLAEARVQEPFEFVHPSLQAGFISRSQIAAPERFVAVARMSDEFATGR